MTSKMTSSDLIRVSFHEDTSHYRDICRECWNEKSFGFSIFTSPDFLQQTKIICTDEYWLPAWNFVVRLMQMDVHHMSSNRCVPHVLDEYLKKIDDLRDELIFWKQKELWGPYFRDQRALREFNLAHTQLKHILLVLIQDMERWLHDHDIPKCLFIRHMHVAHEVLKKIFGLEYEHLICMILTHLYMLENPTTHLYHIIPRAKRLQFKRYD